MNKKMICFTLVCFMLTLSSCVDINNRFSIPLEEGLYVYRGNENNKNYYLGYEITLFSLELYTNEVFENDLNVFLDYSTNKPYLKYGCRLIIGFDGVSRDFNIRLIGRANPGEDNAYEMAVLLDFDDIYEEYHFIFRLDLSDTGELEFDVQLLESLSSSGISTNIKLTRDSL